MPSYSSSSAMRSDLEAQLSFMPEITRKTFDSVLALSALNMRCLQQIMQDCAEASRQLAQCRNPFELAASAAHAAQPIALHLHSYQQQLFGILTGAQVDLTRNAQAFLPEGLRDASPMAHTSAHECPSTATASAVRPEFSGNGAAGSGPHSLH